MNMENLSPETFFSLPPADQDRIMREWLGEFSENELLALIHMRNRI